MKNYWKLGFYVLLMLAISGGIIYLSVIDVPRTARAGQSFAALLGALIFLAVVFCFYFLPSIVAIGSKHKQTAPVVVLNLFLGWTVIGWVVALVIAVWNSDKEK